MAPRGSSLSLAQARRLALAAQGFADPPPGGAADRRHLERVLKRVGLFQIDSVNVLVRSHYLPAFARLGRYPAETLDAIAWGRPSQRRLFEYWGHEASLIPLEWQPLFRWRMADAARGQGLYGGLARFGREKRRFVERVFAEIERRGPLAAGELESGAKGRPGWWEWSEEKTALEWLFWAGRITTATRRRFERLYDVTERALPARILERPTPPREEAIRRLLAEAGRALGVATQAELRDYFRLPVAGLKERIAELVEAGTLEPVAVEGWRQPAFRHAGARLPRRVARQALLSPFDSLVWERGRTERLFGFRYRLEIYTPAAKRRYGYYVLPLLLDERLAARVCLKAERAEGRLAVNAAWAESHARPEAVAPALAEELQRLAGWLGLGGLRIGRKGDLAAALRRAVGS